MMWPPPPAALTGKEKGEASEIPEPALSVPALPQMAAVFPSKRYFSPTTVFMPVNTASTAVPMKESEPLLLRRNSAPVLSIFISGIIVTAFF